MSLVTSIVKMEINKHLVNDTVHISIKHNVIIIETKNYNNFKYCVTYDRVVHLFQYGDFKCIAYEFINEYKKFILKKYFK